MFEREVFYILTLTNSWYNDLKYYLVHGSSSSHLDARKRQAWILKSSQYQLVNGVLFHQNYDNVLLRCSKKDDVDQVLIDLHDGLVSGHFGWEVTTHKVLRVGYYLATLFKDAHAYARKCQIFQANVGTERILSFPLPVVTIQNPLNNED